VLRVIKKLESRSDITFTPNIYCSLITSYANADLLEKADHLFDIMLREGLNPPVKVFNALIRGHGKVKDIQGIQDILQKMQDMGMKMTLTTYNNLMRAYADAHIPEKALETFDKLVKESEKGVCFRPDEASFNILIDMFGKLDDVPSAVHWTREMLKYGFQPSAYALTSIMNGIRRTGSIEECKAALALFAERGLATKAAGPYSVLISMHLKDGNIKGSLEVYDDMIQKRVQLDRYLFQQFIFYHTRRQEMQEAMDWYDRMKKAGISSDGKTLYWLLRGWGKVGAGEAETEMLLEEAVKAGIKDPLNSNSASKSYW
jgi:pentatricopeptide repeat domain-containing protein 1